MAGRIVAMFIAKPIVLILIGLLCVSYFGHPGQSESSMESDPSSLVQYSPGRVVIVKDKHFPVEPFWFELSESVLDQRSSTMRLVLRAVPGRDPLPFPIGYVPGFGGAITAINSGSCENGEMYRAETLHLPFVCPIQPVEQPLLFSIFFGKHGDDGEISPVVWSGALLQDKGQFRLEVDPAALLAHAKKLDHE